MDADISFPEVLPSQTVVPDNFNTIRCQDTQSPDVTCTQTSEDYLTGMPSHNLTNIMMSSCSYTRGGWCKKHEKVGEKVIKTTKSWGALKNGLFGHKLAKKVTWRCKETVFSGQFRLSSTTRDEFSCSETMGILGVTLGDLSVGRKRKVQNSLEPRCESKRTRLQPASPTVS